MRKRRPTLLLWGTANTQLNKQVSAHDFDNPDCTSSLCICFRNNQ